MSETSDLHRQLLDLKYRMEGVNRVWTPKDHEALMQFFVEILPPLMQAERCSIFIADPLEKNVWVKFGTELEEREITAPLTGSLVGKCIGSQQTVIRNKLDPESGFHATTDKNTSFHTHSLVCVPIMSLVREEAIGAVQVLNRRGDGLFGPEEEALLQRLTPYLALAVESSVLNREIGQLSNQLQRDMAAFARELPGNVTFITRSPAMIDRVKLVQQVSLAPVNVFITGESGAGKELIARMVHQNSDRRQGPFVAVNCSAIPENLMESEFFGHEKGAFTGADGQRIGRFEEAAGGILFLDEIADMPMSIQPKFLRAIQEMEGSRLGSNTVRSYDFRLVSASRSHLKERVAQGLFREDLYFRLFSVEVDIPPLRRRPEDILPLAIAFLEEIAERFKKKLPGFAPETLALFEAYAWPGNVRQLRHEIERLAALTPEGRHLPAEHCSRELTEMLDDSPTAKGPASFNLAEARKHAEIMIIKAALKRTGGAKLQAAELLGITRQSLHGKIRQYGLG